jgi:hypothetical protein
VSAVVLAHPGSPGGSLRFTSTQAAGVRLCTPADAAEVTGAFLLPEAGRVDRRVLHRLLTEGHRTRRVPPILRRPLLGPLGRLRNHYAAR